MEWEASFSAPGTHLCGLAWDGRHLWHSDADTERIYRLDPASGEATAGFPCPQVRTELAYADGRLWQVAGRPKRIRILDPRDGRVLEEVPLGPESERVCGLAVAGDRYWVEWEELGRLQEREVATHEVLAGYAVPPGAAGLTLVHDDLWFSDHCQGTLGRLERATGRVQEAFRVPGTPTGLAWDGDRFWTCDFASRRIAAVRPEGQL